MLFLRYAVEHVTVFVSRRRPPVVVKSRWKDEGSLNRTQLFKAFQIDSCVFATDDKNKQTVLRIDLFIFVSIRLIYIAPVCHRTSEETNVPALDRYGGVSIGLKIRANAFRQPYGAKIPLNLCLKGLDKIEKELLKIWS